MAESVEIDALRDELAELRAELQALRARSLERDEVDDEGLVPESALTRRNWMKAAAAAAVGGTALALAPSQPAAAVDLVLGAVNTTATPTTVNFTGTEDIGTLFQSGNAFVATSSTVDAALAGWTTRSTNPVGVYGYSTVTSTGEGVRGSAAASALYGVHAEHRTGTGTALRATGGGASTGRGLHATGGTAVSAVGSIVGVVTSGQYGVNATGSVYGVSTAGSKANMHLQPSGVGPPARTDIHEIGEIVMSLEAGSQPTMWMCVVAGAPGTWQKISGHGVAGAFHAIEPNRAYDSRSGIPNPGTLVGGANRIVSVADGRNLDSGAVTLADIVPVGATAVTYNLACTQTVGFGFLTVAPGDATGFSAASINWTTSGLDISNAGTVKIDASRQVKVFCGGGSSHFVIDITGFYR